MTLDRSVYKTRGHSSGDWALKTPVHSATVATLMLSAGVPAHVVQRRLGQAKTVLVPFHEECSVNPVATVSEGHLSGGHAGAGAARVLRTSALPDPERPSGLHSGVERVAFSQLLPVPGENAGGSWPRGI